VALASGIGGAIVEVFAGTYLYLYKHASDQLAAFRTPSRIVCKEKLFKKGFLIG